MSRPRPTVLLTHTDRLTHKTEEILESEAVFAVYYKDVPINLKSSHSLVNYPGPKYKRCSHSNPAHALNLAERLNDTFNCDDFKVFKMVRGEEVYKRK